MCLSLGRVVWLYHLQEIPKFMRSSKDMVHTLWVMLSEPGLGLAGAHFFPMLSVLWDWTYCEPLGQVIRKLNVCCGVLPGKPLAS